jgi:hypothetical protein
MLAPEDLWRFRWPALGEPTAPEWEDRLLEWVDDLDEYSAQLAGRSAPPAPGRLEPGWDLLSLLDALHHGEYELGTCTLDGDGRGALTLEPWAWPFGGLGALIALVEGFGGVVIRTET